jgi:hypothetical protein
VRTTDNTHVPLGGLALTDAALVAIGVQPGRFVPLVGCPWRPDERDRKPDDDQEDTGDR